MSASDTTFVGSVFTAVHVWFYACRLLVGGALLEFAWVLKKLSGGSRMTVAPNHKKEGKIHRYDFYAFIVFNSLFVVFCVIYGVVCLSQ